MKQLTQAQLEILQPFEYRMTSALYSNWCSAVSATELQRVVDIYNDVTGNNRRANANCASCILEIFADMGRIYFEQKEAVEKASKVKVEKSSVKAANIAGVAVKTKKAAK